VDGGCLVERRLRPEPNRNALLMIPLTFDASYMLRLFSLRAPALAGGRFGRHEVSADSHVDFILKPGFKGLWRYSNLWSFGINVSYWWVLQLATGDQPSSQARMGNFLEVTATALRHL